VTKQRPGVPHDQMQNRCQTMPKAQRLCARLSQFNGEPDHQHPLIFYPPKAAVPALVNSRNAVPASRPRTEITSPVRATTRGHCWPASYPAAGLRSSSTCNTSSNNSRPANPALLYRRPVYRYSLPGDNVFPEGITEGGGTGFFVGSMGDGTIYYGDTETGRVEPFLPADGDGRTTITGLDVDAHGRLIACDYDGGQLFIYSLANRTLVARRPLPAQESWPNDVVVAGDSAYVTDTRHPRVWRLPVGEGEVGEPGVIGRSKTRAAANPARLPAAGQVTPLRADRFRLVLSLNAAAADRTGRR
jgi:hypothetical protein